MIDETKTDIESNKKTYTTIQCDCQRINENKKDNAKNRKTIPKNGGKNKMNKQKTKKEKQIKCKHCKNILIKNQGKNGHYYTCYNCQTRYKTIKNKLTETPTPRFQLCNYDPDLNTWAVDDTLTDGKYIQRITKEKVIQQLNELDIYTLQLMKENLQAYMKIAELETKIAELEKTRKMK